MTRVASAALVALIAIVGFAPPSLSGAQTREKGPWWPSPHGPQDQAGNTNYLTPEKVLEALKLAKTGQMYELGHIYESSMPAYGSRPYYINVTPGPTSADREGVNSVHQDYFNGFIGQMGTQFDAFGHMGRSVKMADGTIRFVYYNGFTEEDLTGRARGAAGLENLGVESVKPIITRGVLIDIAAAKGVPTLDAAYEVTMADVRAALARQMMTEDSVRRGDALLFNYGWAVNWTNPSKYNDGRVGTGDNKGSPGIGFEVAQWITTRSVAMVGADTCCVMVMPESRLGNVHHELLLNGTTILENMDLLELARDRVYEFLYVGPTIRIKGATGSPVRPVAIR